MAVFIAALHCLFQVEDRLKFHYGEPPSEMGKGAKESQLPSVYENGRYVVGQGCVVHRLGEFYRAEVIEGE